MSNRIHTMPEELKSPVKVGKNFYFFDLVFVVSWTMVFSVIGQSFIHPELSILYMIWNGIVAIILTRPAFGNPEKRIYYSFLFFLIKDRKVYHAINNERSLQHEIFQKTIQKRRQEIIESKK